MSICTSASASTECHDAIVEPQQGQMLRMPSCRILDVQAGGDNHRSKFIRAMVDTPEQKTTGATTEDLYQHWPPET